MNILLTNDDGITAPGIWAAACALATLGQVTVVAPATNYSGYGAALPPTCTLSYSPYRHPRNHPARVQAHGLAGTPATCAHVGLSGVLGGGSFDLLVSGKAINIQPWPVLGMFMPDGIAAFGAAGETFYVTANEGDARNEDRRIGSLNLDPVAFPNAAELKHNARLDRLHASSIDGDLDGDDAKERPYIYGARSFSVWDAAGNLVWDSGSELERLTAQLTPALFNANNGNPANWDERSDDKGPEPEGLAVGAVQDRPYAFVGLERAGGGVMAYDLSDPRQPVFVGYFRADADISPEGVLFIPAEASPTGKPLVVLTHEISNTVAIYEVRGPNVVYYLPFVTRQ